MMPMNPSPFAGVTDSWRRFCMSNDQHDDLPPRPSLSIPFPLEIGDFHFDSPTDLPETRKNEAPNPPDSDQTPPGRAENERRS
jgi:hypothetical protein